MAITFENEKILFDDKYRTAKEIDCFLPVHLTIGGKENDLYKKDGSHNEQYYKWQFLYCFVSAGLCSKDFIGVEVSFPKGNKNSASIKLDAAIFDNKDWFEHYSALHTKKDDSKWDELNWLKEHLICGIEFKKEGSKDIKGVFNSQLKAYMNESSKETVFGILYDEGRLYLFKGIGNYGELRYFLDTPLIESNTKAFLENMIEDAFNSSSVPLAVLIKNHSEDRRTVVSFLLSALFNNISKKKEGYNLFGRNHAGKAMLLIDIAFYIYSFYPSFDQTRKMISMLTYINDEIDFKNEADFNKKLRNKIEQYSFVFETGNLHDLCDWLPFFYEYKINMKIDIENLWIDTAYKVNDPIIWANILIYSRYNENLHKDTCLKLENIITAQLSKIVYSDPMMNDEFWYVLIFHNCPFLTQPVKDRLSDVIDTIKSKAVSSKPSPTHCIPSYDIIIMLCSFLQLQSTAGNKPENSFFNWKGVRDFSEIVTYRTYQRTVFKRYKKNNNGLYASIN